MWMIKAQFIPASKYTYKLLLDLIKLLFTGTKNKWRHQITRETAKECQGNIARNFKNYEIIGVPKLKA